jgi:hypothetical protein
MSLSAHRTSDESNTGSTTKMVKDLDALIQSEKVKTWNKLLELQALNLEEEQDNTLLEQLDSRNKRSGNVSFEDGEVSASRRERKPLTKSAQSSAAKPSVVPVMVPIFSKETGSPVGARAMQTDHNYFSDSSSSASSFRFNETGGVDIDVRMYT